MKNKIWHTVMIIAIPLAIIGVAYYSWSLANQNLKIDVPIGEIALFMIMGLWAIFILVVGKVIFGSWMGALIDERNRISLSRLQHITWTIVILAGLLMAAIWNLRHSFVDPLNIAIPSELWVILGVSSTALIGSPLIRANKTDKDAATKEAQRNLPLLAQQRRVHIDKTLNLSSITSNYHGPPPSTRAQADVITRTMTIGSVVQPRTTMTKASQQQTPGQPQVTLAGQVVMFTDPKMARLADLFEGEEVGNAGHLDIGKIQMFFFTLVMVFIYAAELAAMFANFNAKIDAFPSISSSMVVLLSISNAGYLANKAAPHSLTPV